MQSLIRADLPGNPGKSARKRDFIKSVKRTTPGFWLDFGKNGVPNFEYGFHRIEIILRRNPVHLHQAEFQCGFEFFTHIRVTWRETVGKQTCVWKPTKKEGFFGSIITRSQEKMYEFHWEGGTMVKIRYYHYVKKYGGSEFLISINLGSQQSAEK